MKAIKSSIKLIKSYPELKNFYSSKAHLKLARVLNFFKVKGFCMEDISEEKYLGITKACFSLHNKDTEFCINYFDEDFFELQTYIDTLKNEPGLYNFINSENLITKSGLFLLMEDEEKVQICIKSKYFGEFSPTRFEIFFKLFLEDVEIAREVELDFKKENQIPY